MKNQSSLFTRWYQELVGFNFTMIHKKGKENTNTDALSRSSHIAEEDDLSEIDEPVFKFEEGVNEIWYIQQSLIEIAEEQAKDEVRSEVISWIEQVQLPKKTETGGKAREVLVVCSMLIMKCS